jgi:hypothetical protein
MTYRDFAIEYLQGQDEVDMTDETIEVLADKMQAEGIPIEDYDDMDEDEIWGIRDRINQLADEI